MSAKGTDLKYLRGFGNHHQTEAKPGALPTDQNSPQKAPHGLYPEQFSSSAFTMSRPQNRRAWLYRIRPSVLVKSPYTETKIADQWQTPPHSDFTPTPSPLRWGALADPQPGTSFLKSVFTMVVNGDVALTKGCANHLYHFNSPMKDQYFYNADAEMLFIPERGGIEIKTEFGTLHLSQLEIAVVPRGVKIQVNPLDSQARGYLVENFGTPLELPDLGPIGSNGLADPRHFLAPTAAYEQRQAPCQLIAKTFGKFWMCELEDSPLDVVAWHGNTFPYKYNLALFNTINTVSFDHPDPSIFTVLTSKSEIAGLANLDFVIFPPRWMVAEHTFRPPYYHRNIMSEFMGLIKGVYDAKLEGFVPGGSSLHNCMSPHGPDATTYENASNADLKPNYLGETMAFMVESRFPFSPTRQAMESKMFQKDYYKCWQGLKPNFRG